MGSVVGVCEGFAVTPAEVGASDVGLVGAAIGNPVGFALGVAVGAMVLGAFVTPARVGAKGKGVG